MKFFLSNEVYLKNIQIMQKLSEQNRQIAKTAGTSNEGFNTAWKKLYQLLENNRFDLFKIENRFDVRALSVALTGNKKQRQKIKVDIKLLESVSKVIPNGSNLFIESIVQFFLSNFDSIKDQDIVGQWIWRELSRKGFESFDIVLEAKLLSSDGPKYLAEQAIQNEITFDHQITRYKLDKYANGDFIRHAQTIYYVEQLQNIPINEPHELLEEISKKDVANSRYDAQNLIGHIALRILIDRAPYKNIHESWQNAVITIAGDPRVPKEHPRYIKWWSHLTKEQNKKVQTWLSKLDLKLFLEALEDYSISSRDGDMMRMFPSRKFFLEGLYESGSIVHTKLYLSRQADHYIKKHYKSEHVPDYSIIENGDRSIIYVELTKGHIVEGSHNCQIWFYDKLHESAPVLQYGKQRLKYEDLTVRMNRKMTALGCGAFEHFIHVSSEKFKWQKKSIETLQKMGLPIHASDVLSREDYNKYKRLYGVS
jgi:hypothetical protein